MVSCPNSWPLFPLLRFYCSSIPTIMFSLVTWNDYWIFLSLFCELDFFRISWDFHFLFLPFKYSDIFAIFFHCDSFARLSCKRFFRSYHFAGHVFAVQSSKTIKVSVDVSDARAVIHNSWWYFHIFIYVNNLIIVAKCTVQWIWIIEKQIGKIHWMNGNE